MGPMRGFFDKLFRLNGTPVGIAVGFALGLGCSLVPIPVAGMLVGLALAPLLRLNLPATYLGSAVVNPFTGPAFYFAELWIGLRLCGRTAPEWTMLRELSAKGWWELFLSSLGPFAVGAAAMIMVTCTLAFVVVWLAVRRVQALQ